MGQKHLDFARLGINQRRLRKTERKRLVLVLVGCVVLGVVVVPIMLAFF